MIYKRLGDLMVSEGMITTEQLDEALAAQKKSGGKKLGEILLEKGFIQYRQLHQVIEKQLGVQFIDLTHAELSKDLANVLPVSLAKKHSVAPVKSDATSIYIAMEDTLNFVAIDEVHMATKLKVIPMLASIEGINRAIANIYGSVSAEKALEELKEDDENSSDFQNIAAQNVIGADSENAAPTIRLVNSFLEYAVNQNASDVHLEPRESSMAVRMRIDGVLRQVFTVPRGTQNAVIARIKVMGNMNIAEHRIPLDGRSNVHVGDRDVDLRISTLPTVFGEKVVIPLLYKTSGLLSTQGIGLQGKNLQKYNALLQNSNGVILIVGPTGSGKSSTMYTMIGNLNKEEVNLVTLEDPVEYNFDGVNQVQINEKTGMTFANGLRAILRQDPDIIAVGEIRDGETADIAMRAAITGHLVLSTLHTNDAPSTIDRLVDMGVENYLISGALRGIISQRLVRRICPNCRTEYEASQQEQEMIHLPYIPGRKFYKGKGCPMCFNTGFRGRTAVFEILIINTKLRHALADNESHSRILELINESDFEPLISDCLRLVLNGTTTVGEAFRTVHSTDE